MFRQLRALTFTTIQDGVRSQVFVNLAVFAVFAVAGSLVMEGVTVGEYGRVLVDLGVAGTSLVNALLATFMVVRSRPVGRPTVILGKFMGVWALVGINALGAMVLVWLVGYGNRGVLVADLARSALGLWLEGGLVVAVTLAFSTFTGSTVAAVLGLGTWVCGLFAGELRDFAARNAEGGLGTLVAAFYYAVPNLQRVDFHATDPSLPAAALAAGYALLYVATALGLAAAVFERRDVR
jgi:ABC-type transport system involved in multi-copper enzyme maturation permease subunit